MKLTKGMKKALSLLLSAAMVVTGVNVTTNTASADTTSTATTKEVSYTATLTSAASTAAAVAGETTDVSGDLELTSTWAYDVDSKTNKVKGVYVTLSGFTGLDNVKVVATDAEYVGVMAWTDWSYHGLYTGESNTDETKTTVDYGAAFKNLGANDNANGDAWEDGVNFYLDFAKYAKVTITATKTVESEEPTSTPTTSAVAAPTTSAVAAPTTSAVADNQPSAPADDNQPSTPADDNQPSAPADDNQPSTPAENPSSSAVAASEAPAETEGPSEQDTAFLMFTDGNWSWGNWNTKVKGGFGKDAVITGDGDYSVSIDADGWSEYNAKTEDFALSAADGATVFCVDIQGLCNSPNLDISEMKVSNLKIYADNKSISVNTANVKMGDIEGKGNFRIDIYNAYGPTADDPAIDETEITFEKSLKVSFTLSGIKAGTSSNAFNCDTTGDGNNDTFTALDDATDEWSDEGEVDPEPLNPVATLTPVEDDTTASTEPADTTTSETPADTNTSATPASGSAASTTPASGSAASAAPASGGAASATPATATPAAVTSTTAVKATSKITVAKSLVVVAPGKSATVKFTAKKAKGTSGAAVVKATSQSKKVAKVTVKGAKIKITVPKKAVKGASTKITLKSDNSLTGKPASATVKVYVRNTAKKVKAAKKSITVKKKKTVKLVLNASGKIQNKKKPVAETVTVQGKVVKLTAVKYAKKKITVTLQGVKKAKNKAVTIKVGTKKVKVKVTVK